MTRRTAGTLSAFAILAVLAAVVALTAQAGTAARATATSTTVVHAVGDAEVHGAVSLTPTPGGEGTSVALTVHGLSPGARVEARLHSGRSLERLSTSSTALPGGRASGAGSLRAAARLLFRGGHEVRSSLVADGAHTVLVHANGRLVAYSQLPRGY